MGLIGGCCLSLIAIVAPPVPVLLRTGVGGSLLLNCFLCILGWIPGVFHAWYIIIRYPDGKHRSRKVTTYEESRTSHRRYSGGYAAAPPRRSHENRAPGYYAAPPHRGSRGYGAPPAAQGGLYYPPQETGSTRRH